MVKLHKKQHAIHVTLQNAVVAAINDPNYSFSLPPLSDWDSVVSSSVDEKQRLEFVGDAIMHLAVALYLYRRFPNAAPGFYTKIRSAVNTNATFTHLMVKAGAFELPSQSHSTKAVADSFEVIVAALYMERGFPDVCVWVQEQYAPLIAAARRSYDEFFTTSDRDVPLSSSKRRAGPLDLASTPLLKKLRSSSSRGMPRSALMAQRIIKRMRSKGKVKLYFPTKKPNVPLEMRLRSCELRIPRCPRPPSIVIDLTGDSHSDGEGPTSSNAMQASQPNFELASPQNRLSLSPPSPESSQGSIDAHLRCPPIKGSIASLSLSHKPSESRSSRSSCTVATSPATSTASQATPRLFSPSGLSVPPHLDRVHSYSGTYENPIVIEDSDTES